MTPRSPSATTTRKSSTRSTPSSSRATAHAALGSRAELRPAAPRPRRRRCRPAGGSTSPAAKAAASSAEGLDGLPIVKPPYGVMAAIDLKNRTSCCSRCRTATRPTRSATTRCCKGMNIPKTGQSGSVGVLITKTLRGRRRPAVHRRRAGRGRGAMLRAYDKQTGAQVGEVLAAGAGRRPADDLLAQRPAVHRRRRQRRQLHAASTSRSALPATRDDHDRSPPVTAAESITSARGGVTPAPRSTYGPRSAIGSQSLRPRCVIVSISSRPLDFIGGC